MGPSLAHQALSPTQEGLHRSSCGVACTKASHTCAAVLHSGFLHGRGVFCLSKPEAPARGSAFFAPRFRSLALRISNGREAHGARICRRHEPASCEVATAGPLACASGVSNAMLRHLKNAANHAPPKLSFEDRCPQTEFGIKKQKQILISVAKRRQRVAHGVSRGIRCDN